MPAYENLPQWIRDRNPGVAYFPRRGPFTAEAWPVTYRATTGATQVVARDEFSHEMRFRVVDPNHDPILMGALSEVAILIPATDSRVKAASERTEVCRTARNLQALLRKNAPDCILTTADLADRIAAIRDAAALAYEAITTLVANRPAS